MATNPDIDSVFGLREELIRIDTMLAENQKLWREVQKLSAESTKLSVDTRLATPAVIFQGLIAVAALLGAGAALGKLFF